MMASYEQFFQPLVCRLERNRAWVLLVFSVAYFMDTTLMAGGKPLENDELYTFYIAQLHSSTEIWKFLLTGADQNPPPFYFVSWISLALPIPPEIAIRLPAVLGFWVMAICLFFIISRQSSVVWGLIAMIFPFTTAAGPYAYEARPYGLLLGCTGLVWYSWILVTENPKSKIKMICLALSLTAAVCTHYYAMLLVLAVATGEIARSIQRRQVDVRVWLAFFVGALPLVAFAPLMMAAASFGKFWAQPTWGLSLGFYTYLLGPATAVLVAIASLLELGLCGNSPQEQFRHGPATRVPPAHELVGTIALIGLPVMGIIVGKVVTGAYVDRYLLPALLGTVFLFCWVARYVSSDRAVVVVMLACILVLGAAVQQLLWYRSFHSIVFERASLCEWLQRQPSTELPIAITDPALFFEMSHYAPRETTERIFYVADPDDALRRVGTNWVDRGLLSMKQLVPLRVQSLSELPKSFLVYESGGSEFAWLLPELLERGFPVRIVASRGGQRLCLISARHR
jgi:hypothetical protein